MDRTEAAEVPGERIGNAMPGLKNLGSPGVGEICAGRGVDRIVVAKVLA